MVTLGFLALVPFACFPWALAWPVCEELPMMLCWRGAKGVRSVPRQGEVYGAGLGLPSPRAWDPLPLAFDFACLRSTWPAFCPILAEVARRQPIAPALSSPGTTPMHSRDDSPTLSRATLGPPKPPAPQRSGQARWPLASRWFGLVVLFVLLPACRSYTERTSRAVALFEAGRFDQASQVFADQEVTGSTFLSGAEGGMAALMAGDLDRAIELFTQAAEFAEEVEDQALLDPTSFAQTLTSWAISEAALDYQGEGYERVMVHVCMGLAYLARGEVDGLMVEVRRANDLLAAEETLYETEYRAGGLGHFLSALGYELRGEYDEAYIDYWAMHEKGLAAPLVGPALVRLAKRMHRENDLPELMSTVGDVAPIPEDAAKVVLIAGVGFGPQKVENRLDVPTSNGVFSWAVPQFVTPQQAFPSIELQTGDLVAEAVVVEDVSLVAEKNLSDRLAYLAAKSAVRGILKQKLAREIRKEHGEGAYALAQIFSMVTERADLRSWLTLPSSWQAARTYPRPGLVEVSLHSSAGETLYLGTYDMEPGETIYLLARSIGPRVFAQVIGGQRVDLEPATTETPNSTP